MPYFLQTFHLERPGSKAPTKKPHSCVPDDREAKVSCSATFDFTLKVKFERHE